MAEEVEVLVRSFRNKHEVFVDALTVDSTKPKKTIAPEVSVKPSSASSDVLPEIVCGDSPNQSSAFIKRRPSTKGVIKFALTPTHAPTFRTDQYLTSQQLNMVELKDLMSSSKVNTSVDGSATRSISADESSSEISNYDSHDSYGSTNFKSSHDYSLATSCNSNNQSFAISQRLYRSLDENPPHLENKFNVRMSALNIDHVNN